MAKKVETAVFMGKERRVSRKPRRCYYCGAKVQTVREEPTMFHKDGCKVAETRDKTTGKTEAETIYPTICHGGWLPLFYL
jgi:hypothetical protein